MDQIAHFKILEEIGSGGMGVVYRARDQRLRRKVALKVLPAGALAEPTIRERLMREAQTMSALEHPNIVTVYDIQSEGDRDFIAMELVAGRSLDQLIQDQGLPSDKALHYAVQIADGLACAHEHGVIHRDLKPQNIMITPKGQVKILDFGLAKRFLPSEGGDLSQESSLMTLTAPGVKVGTPAYMSPEQIETRPIDGRSDIFSFGCLLYQMLTGVNPFHRPNVILIFKAVLSESPEPLRTLEPELPEELEPILSKALAKAPDDRYAEMRQLWSELKAVHAQLMREGAGRRSSGTEWFRRPVLATGDRRGLRSWRSARWLGPLLIAVIGLVAIGWVAIGWQGGGQSSERRSPQLGQAGPVASVPAASFTPGVARAPALSASGERVAYFQPEVGAVGGLWVAPVDGGAPRRLFKEPFRGGEPVWWPGDRWIVFSADLGGEMNLWRVSADGGEPEQLTFGAGDHRSPTISADGRRLAYTVAQPGAKRLVANEEIWVAEIK